jgi:hypothetical protein
MSAQTAEITKRLGVCQAVAALPTVINAVKQTGFHSVWDRGDNALMMWVSLDRGRKLGRQLTIDAAKGEEA